LLNIFLDNLINRTVCLLLVIVFLTTFPTGSTALAFCLDEQESHVVVQDFYLVDCHSAVEEGLSLSDENFFALAEKEKNDCTDISLTNANILNRPSRIILPASAKVILSSTLPRGLVSLQQQVPGQSSSALSQPFFVLPHIEVQRTIILLI
jgi:hypothetical protein